MFAGEWYLHKKLCREIEELEKKIKATEKKKKEEDYNYLLSLSPEKLEKELKLRKKIKIELMIENSIGYAIILFIIFGLPVILLW